MQSRVTHEDLIHQEVVTSTTTKDNLDLVQSKLEYTEEPETTIINDNVDLIEARHETDLEEQDLEETIDEIFGKKKNSQLVQEDEDEDEDDSGIIFPTSNSKSNYDLLENVQHLPDTGAYGQNYDLSQYAIGGSDHVESSAKEEDIQNGDESDDVYEDFSYKK